MYNLSKHANPNSKIYATAGAALLATLAATWLTTSPVEAHARCGARVFPVTLNLDDPGVGDELSLPTFQFTPANQQGWGGTFQNAFEWDKRITPTLAVSIQGDYQFINDQGAAHNGFDNFNAGVKWNFLCADSHEFMASIGVNRTFGGSGSADLLNNAYISSVGTTNPTLYFGKGFGDLPIGFLRPLAITGQFSRQLSDNPALQAGAWTYAFSLQYSIPYLQQNVQKLGLPEFIGNLTPVVELSMNSQDNGATTGTISPGLMYSGETWQLAVEATIPVNDATAFNNQNGIGVVAQMHFFLDDIFPNGIGKPLFGSEK